MKVIVDDNVVKAIDDFYIAAMSRHISLSEETVMAKKERLLASLESLKDYYFIYSKARWKDEWIKTTGKILFARISISHTRWFLIRTAKKSFSFVMRYTVYCTTNPLTLFQRTPPWPTPASTATPSTPASV